MTDYLITGGKGFIGQNLCDFLESRARSYAIIDYNPDNDPLVIRKDLTSGSLPEIPATKVVHLAALTNVRYSIKHPLNVAGSNYCMTLNTLELARKMNVKKLIFTSSISAPNCTSPYLASKLACEALCIAYRKSYGLETSILRLSNVYGPYSRHKTSVIHTFIQLALRRQNFEITGDGSQLRDFIHVNDVVRAIYLGKPGYIASGKLTSISEVASMVSDISADLINFEPKFIFRDSVKGEVYKPVARSTINPTIDLYSGIKSTFKWYIKDA